MTLIAKAQEAKIVFATNLFDTLTVVQNNHKMLAFKPLSQHAVFFLNEDPIIDTTETGSNAEVKTYQSTTDKNLRASVVGEDITGKGVIDNDHLTSCNLFYLNKTDNTRESVSFLRNDSTYTLVYNETTMTDETANSAIMEKTFAESAKAFGTWEALIAQAISYPKQFVDQVRKIIPQ